MLIKIEMLEAKFILLKASADRDLPSQVPPLYCWGPWLGFTWQKDEAKDAQWPLVCLCCDGIEVDNLRMTKCLKRLSIMSAEVEVLQYCISLDELINQNNMLK